MCIVDFGKVIDLKNGGLRLIFYCFPIRVVVFLDLFLQFPDSFPIIYNRT